MDHIDFTLSVHTTDITGAYNKSKNKQGEDIRSCSQYIFPESTISVEVFDPETNNSLRVESRTHSHPVFYENKDYNFDIRFKHKVRSPRVYSRLKEITEKFYQPNDDAIAGGINFGNDIGKSDFIIRYEKNEHAEEFVLSFEVFPTKLDYQKDYRRIVEDIEREYPLLVLDFLRKTYSNFHSGNSQSTDLIWWQIFGGLYQDFIRASQFILNKPHSRLINESTCIKRDRIKLLTPALEEELVEFKNQPNRYYQIQRKILSTNTPENRFFKYALRQITSKFSRLKNYIGSNFKITYEFQTELNRIERCLVQFNNHQFFKTVGEFKGMRQESMVLQKATGYSAIYQDWIMLNQGMNFFEGVQKIEMKKISDLYQIWCFLEMKKILQALLGKNPTDIRLANIEVDGFVFKFDTGKRSKVAFKNSNGDLIELFHDYQFNVRSSENVTSHTVSQRPDIVLQITKNDLKDLYTFTYLYDAKYRLQSDESEDGPDYPPEDAINQMHRYRDAIYYQNKSLKKSQKEVIGGYILFPGAGEVDEIKKLRYSQSIAEVNIGAYPLRPNDYSNRTLLEKHLSDILNIDSENILQEVIAHKDLVYENSNPEVLIGIVSKEDHKNYFESGKATLYHTGEAKPSRFGFGNLKFFAPYIQGKGVKEYYEILSYSVTPRNEIYSEGDVLHKTGDISERLVLVLGKRIVIKNGQYLTCGITVYRYCKLLNLRNPVDNIINVEKVSDLKKLR